VSGFRLVAADEGPHVPTADENFNESVYVNGFDPVRRAGVWMRIGNRVNEGHAELQVCAYLPDGRIACQFQRPPIASNAAFAAGGMRYAVVEPLRRVSMRYEGELMLLDDPEWLRDARRLFEEAPRATAALELRFEGVSPVHGGEPLTPTQETMYGRDFPLGHFNQHGRVSARIAVGAEHFDFDACGWRDHSWGPRYWTNVYFYRLLIANFGPERAFMLLKITGRDGVTRRHGVVLIDGEYEEITDLDLFTEWTAAKDPRALRLGVRTPRRAFRLEGEIIRLAPLGNRRKVGDAWLRSRIAEGLTVWRWDQRDGIGITEYIEFLEHGEPVGYPL
jgi:hypothetical protein